jgi:hypothetical protein
MEAPQRQTVRELFSVNRRGTHWVFHILKSGGWTIMQDGERMAEGKADRRSIRVGVKKFTALTHPVAAAPQCSPVVHAQLNRIERNIRRRETQRATPPRAPSFQSRELSAMQI